MTALGAQHKNNYVARYETTNLVQWCSGAVSLLSLVLSLMSLTPWRKEGPANGQPWSVLALDVDRLVSLPVTPICPVG